MKRGMKRSKTLHDAHAESKQNKLCCTSSRISSAESFVALRTPLQGHLGVWQKCAQRFICGMDLLPFFPSLLPHLALKSSLVRSNSAHTTPMYFYIAHKRPRDLAIEMSPFHPLIILSSTTPRLTSFQLTEPRLLALHTLSPNEAIMLSFLKNVAGVFCPRVQAVLEAYEALANLLRSFGFDPFDLVSTLLDSCLRFIYSSRSP